MTNQCSGASPTLLIKAQAASARGEGGPKMKLIMQLSRQIGSIRHAAIYQRGANIVPE
jgi:hypothetical protein